MRLLLLQIQRCLDVFNYYLNGSFIDVISAIVSLCVYVYSRTSLALLTRRVVLGIKVLGSLSQNHHKYMFTDNPLKHVYHI